MNPFWVNQVRSDLGFGYVDRLQCHNRLEQRRLARAVVAEDDGPLGRAAFAVGEVKRLRRAEAADVFERDREEIGRRRCGRAVGFGSGSGLFFRTLAHGAAIRDSSGKYAPCIIPFLLSWIPHSLLSQSTSSKKIRPKVGFFQRTISNGEHNR